MKWTNTLFLGNNCSGAVVIEVIKDGWIKCFQWAIISLQFRGDHIFRGKACLNSSIIISLHLFKISMMNLCAVSATSFKLGAATDSGQTWMESWVWWLLHLSSLLIILSGEICLISFCRPFSSSSSACDILAGGLAISSPIFEKVRVSSDLDSFFKLW